MKTALLFPGRVPAPLMGSAGVDTRIESSAVRQELMLSAAQVLAEQGTARARSIRTGSPAELEAMLAQSHPELAHDLDVLAASLEAFEALRDAQVPADLVAGHGLGELTASVAAGVLRPADAAAVIAERAVATASDTPGCMVAMIKVSRAVAELLVDAHDELVLAHDNAPGQLVVAGSRAAIRWLRQRAADAGARLLDLGPTALPRPIVSRRSGESETPTLASCRLRDPSIPLLTATSVRVLTRADEIAEALAKGPEAPVRWREVQQVLAAEGFSDLVEVGPGRMLSGLARRTVPGLQVHTVTGVDEAETLARSLRARAARGPRTDAA